ncbi:MAG: c-type cytochrome [Limnohabitans sp.]
MNNLSTFFPGSYWVTRFFGLLVFGIAVLSSPPVYAESDPLKKLMQTNNCVACHQIDKRKYGPQFYEVAEKYQGDSTAAGKLATKIKAGGTGVWGEDYMPPQPQVSDADAKSMAELILALKPVK